MSTTTAKYGIQYAQLADTVASLAATMAQLAGRVDLLLGESGSWSPVMAANTVSNTVITLARSYPGNVGAAVPGIVIVEFAGSVGSGLTVFTWVTAWAGTSTTITGFTLNAISSNATTRAFHWRFIPVL